MAPLAPHRHTPDPSVLAAEVEWLLGTDTSAGIARRLGYGSAATLERVLLRAGHVDLAGRVRVREVRA